VHLTQGTFSYLPDLSEAEIRAQVRYMVEQGWGVSVEFSDDPHPRNTYWEMWGMPMFDLRDPALVVAEVDACRRAHPNHYVKLNGFDPTALRQGQTLSFLVHRPTGEESGYRLERSEAGSQTLGYALAPYVTTRPAGGRYGGNGAQP
jgi:ribulose-bisphosphate carboxylase small chain